MALGKARMERLRADLIRRARNERQGHASEEQHASPATPSNNPGNPAPRGSSTRGISFLGRALPTISVFSPPAADNEAPKSPEMPRRPFTLASSRYSGSGGPPSSLPSPVPMAHLQRQQPSSDSVAAPARQRDRLAIPGFNDPPRPSAIVDVESQVSQTQSSEGSGKAHTKRFLFCFPWVKSRRVRTQILTCLVSGMFLAILLAVYLGLALTNHISRGELTIMIILIILSATMFFCYSVIRLCLLVSRGDRSRRRRFPEMMTTGGYVVPPKPIPVVLARDEEAVGIESDAAKSRPPAYGLWRESVRVDPNRLFWQRNEAAEVAHRPETRAGPRPPSYASDDGISYVVEARPRSLAPPSRASEAHGFDVSGSRV